MIEHMQLSDMPQFCETVKTWLNGRYGGEQGAAIWQKTAAQYDEYLKDLPDYGGKKANHALAIYGALLIFSLYPLLPDQPPMEEIQDFVQNLFMGAFGKLGRIFNLNRGLDMRLINAIFQNNGKKDQKNAEQHPAAFHTVTEPYDRENRAARYRFTQCPNAEFAKKHNLLHVLPLFCNSDFWAMEQLHGTLIRCGTCGNADVCDYCVVGSESPMAGQYEIVKDEKGFLVSRKKG